MWRDKESKKPVYMEVIDKYDIDKNGDGIGIFDTEKFYNCESWVHPVEIEELEKLAEWVEEKDERD